MHLRFFAALTIAAALCAPAGASDGKITIYHVLYQNDDLGTWTTLTIGKSTSGTYDGATFDANAGPGFATISLTRAINASDRASLYKSLPPPNGPLAVTSLQSGKTIKTTRCDKSTVSDFDTHGDPPNGTETIVFACTSIATP